MLTSPLRHPGSKPSATTRWQIRPTLSQSTRDSRVMVVLSVLVATPRRPPDPRSPAVTVDRPELNPERCRANGTASTRTPWLGQTSRRRPARTSTFLRPMSVCRQLENTGRVS